MCETCYEPRGCKSTLRVLNSEWEWRPASRIEISSQKRWIRAASRESAIMRDGVCGVGSMVALNMQSVLHNLESANRILSQSWHREDCLSIWSETGHLFARRASGCCVLHSGRQSKAQRGLQAGQGSNYRTARPRRFRGRRMYRLGSTRPHDNRYCGFAVQSPEN